MKLTAPFPWFGGKSRAAHLLWARLGDCPNYLEPFFGSGAVLLSRPHWQWPDGFAGRLHCESVNDLDGCVANFWRATQRDPQRVAEWASNPVIELDLHARHQWLHSRLLSTDGLTEAVVAKAKKRGILPFSAWMEESPENYDCQVAGWWAWGLGCWIGDNWARPNALAALPSMGNMGQGVCRKLPCMSTGKGVCRKLPNMGSMGNGVCRKLPGSGDASAGECSRKTEALVEWFSRLRDRLRNVDVTCGDWERILGPTPTHRAVPCAIVLDPPYSQDHGLDTVYGEYHDAGVAARVRAWCIEHGNDMDMRIALCGYDTEHGELAEKHGWSVVAWKASGGYSNQGTRGNENAARERIWFSPGCLGEGIGQQEFEM